MSAWEARLRVEVWENEESCGNGSCFTAVSSSPKLSMSVTMQLYEKCEKNCFHKVTGNGF